MKTKEGINIKTGQGICAGAEGEALNELLRGRIVNLPEKGVGEYQALERLIAAEKKSHFDQSRKQFFSASSHLASSPSLPWADRAVRFVEEAWRRFMHGHQLNNIGGMELEGEVISMMSDLLGNENAVGNITTGGSESIFCAWLACKSRARSTGKGKLGHNGSIVLPITAHYSHFKACNMFDMEPIVVRPIPGSFTKVAPEDIRRAVREDTIGILGTAGDYPYGTIDPIEEIGEIAEEKDLYFHVDACFGGLILPFLEKGGYNIEIPKWDFRVKGVSSISVDFLKNGMVPAPSSCILFRNEELLNFAQTIAPPRGCITGTISTGPIAGTWAMLNLLGLEGYIATSRKMMELHDTLKAGVAQIPGLKVVPDSKVNLLVVYSDEYDLMPVIQELRSKGWVMATAIPPRPISISLVTFPINDGQVEPFLADLKKDMRLAEPIKPEKMKVYGLEYPMLSWSRI